MKHSSTKVGGEDFKYACPAHYFDARLTIFHLNSQTLKQIRGGPRSYVVGVRHCHEEKPSGERLRRGACKPTVRECSRAPSSGLASESWGRRKSVRPSSSLNHLPFKRRIQKERFNRNHAPFNQLQHDEPGTPSLGKTGGDQRRQTSSTFRLLTSLARASLHGHSLNQLLHASRESLPSRARPFSSQSHDVLLPTRRRQRAGRNRSKFSSAFA